MFTALPPSMGAIPVTVGCARYGKVLKSCRLFPVNLVLLLFVVVQMFWEEVCRRRRLVRYNSSQRGSGGRSWNAPQGHWERVGVQVAGHASRFFHFVLIAFTFLRRRTALRQNVQNTDTKHWWGAELVFTLTLKYRVCSSNQERTPSESLVTFKASSATPSSVVL